MTSASIASGGKAVPGVLTTSALKQGSGGVWAYGSLFLQGALWLFITLAAWSFNAADAPSQIVYPHNATPLNWCGGTGAFIAYHLLKLLGFGLWVVLGLWGLHLFLTAFVTRVGHASVRLLGVIIMAAAVAGMQAVVFPHSGAIADLGGGLIGSLAADLLGQRFGTAGSLVWLTLSFFVGATVALDIWVILAPLWAFKHAKAAAGPTAAAVTTAATTTATGVGMFAQFIASLRSTDKERRAAARAGHPVLKGLEEISGKRTKKEAKEAAAASKEANKETIDENAGGLGATEAFDPAEHTIKAGEPDAAEEEATDGAAEATEAVEAAEEAEPAPKTFDPETLRAKIAKLPLRFASTEKKAATEEDLRDVQNQTDMEGYKFPGLDLLEEPEANYSQTLEGHVREQATALVRALGEYKIDGEVVGIDSGPVITLYEIRLAAGTKVAALSSLASDLARSLKAVNIRIVPNMAGRDTVGIEVPNPHKEKVRLKELMTKSEQWSAMQLPMFLGKDGSGNPLIADLAGMPHLLIAGTTGSGKSVCMSSILMSFLYTRKPNELKLVLVDPKMVELSQFKDIPHLMCPVVTEMNKAAAILEWATRKMDERYELLVEAGCRDIVSYNALTWEELKERFNPTDEVEAARIPKKLPYMVFVIDELADLIMTNKDVEHSIVRIAQKARAVGIHLIVATQRPQANVVTGLIKSNMPARICFKVSSGMDSRIVMDNKGGELLLGQGDMLYKSPRTTELVRSQGTLVDDREIRRVVKFMKDVAQPTFERSLMQIRTGSEAAGGLSDDGTEDSTIDHDGLANAQADPLFDKAVEIVLETKIGSVSMLQRRLAIGYTRSSRLIDAMGAAGIIGDHKGTVAREVLISQEEWDAMKDQAAADAAANASAGAAGVQNELFPTGEGSPAAAAPQVVSVARRHPEPVPNLNAAPGESGDAFADDADDEQDEDDERA